MKATTSEIFQVRTSDITVCKLAEAECKNGDCRHCSIPIYFKDKKL